RFETLDNTQAKLVPCDTTLLTGCRASCRNHNPTHVYARTFSSVSRQMKPLEKAGTSSDTLILWFRISGIEGPAEDRFGSKQMTFTGRVHHNGEKDKLAATVQLARRAALFGSSQSGMPAHATGRSTSSGRAGVVGSVARLVSAKPDHHTIVTRQKCAGEQTVSTGFAKLTVHPAHTEQLQALPRRTQTELSNLPAQSLPPSELQRTLECSIGYKLPPPSDPIIFITGSQPVLKLDPVKSNCSLRQSRSLLKRYGFLEHSASRV
ncbi:hypothetical protein BaRGS_00014661, partial [Batillaria attramentaria]